MRLRSFVIILVIAILGGLVYVIIKPRTVTIPSTETNTASSSVLTPALTTSPSESKKHTGIQSSWIIVRDMSRLSLHSNLMDLLSVHEAKEKWGCKYIISGGFFGEDGKHLGLFIENSQTLTNEKQSSLFNGFFSIVNGKAQITQNSPASATHSVQTGPLLIKDSNVISLSMVRDENARRMVAAVSPQGEVIFITFYDASSLISGPLLEELPKLISDIDKNTSLEIKDAINLDGGAHSAFISDEVQLTDIQTPGSYFCVKN